MGLTRLARSYGSTYGPRTDWLYTGDPAARALNIASVANRTVYVRRATPAVPISQVVIHQGASSGNIVIAAYAMDLATGLPSTRLATTGSIPCPAANGERTVSLGATVTPEWLSIAADNATATFGVLAGGGLVAFPSAYGRLAYQDAAFPSPDPALPGGFVGGALFLLIGKP